MKSRCYFLLKNFYLVIHQVNCFTVDTSIGSISLGKNNLILNVNSVISISFSIPIYFWWFFKQYFHSECQFEDRFLFQRFGNSNQNFHFECQSNHSFALRQYCNRHFYVQFILEKVYTILIAISTVPLLMAASQLPLMRVLPATCLFFRWLWQWTCKLPFWIKDRPHTQE